MRGRGDPAVVILSGTVRDARGEAAGAAESYRPIPDSLIDSRLPPDHSEG